MSRSVADSNVLASGLAEDYLRTFSFPEGLTLDTPAADYAGDPRAITVATAAQRFVELRYRWLKAPECVESMDEPVVGCPKPAVAMAAAPLKEIVRRTLTNLYNERREWPADVHENLDTAVAVVYEWECRIPNETVLGALFRENLSTFLIEPAGKSSTRWGTIRYPITQSKLHKHRTFTCKDQYD